MTTDDYKLETPADRAWIMAQFREPWKPIALDALTVLRWAAFGAGVAIVAALVWGCAPWRNAELTREWERHYQHGPDELLEWMANPRR